MLYTFQNESIIILHGFIKKSQKIPRKEILLGNRSCLCLTQYNVYVILKTLQLRHYLSPSHISTMKSYAKIKQRLLKDGKVRKAYTELGPEFELAKNIIEKRLAKGFTQSALAHKVGTKQSSIARLESGNYNPSMDFLGKVAKALDSKVVVSLH